MQFIYQFEPNAPKVTMEISPESSLPDVLEAFESFLRAAGYSFEGTLDIVELEN